MGIFVLDFNPQTKTVNGPGLELMRHLILETGFGKAVNRMDVEGMSFVHRLVEEGTDGMIRNATTKHTLYVVMQVIIIVTGSQFSFNMHAVHCSKKYF